MKRLVLDGNSILNRAFYGIKLLTTKSGQYTNAIYGFMNILLRLENAENPDEIAVAFDLRAPTFRHEMYNEYKAHRKGMPEELATQLPLLKELLADLGYVEVTKEGYEADDILGTLAAAAQAQGDECLLATGDRDSLQLVAPGVTVLLTTTQMGRGETTRMDEAAVVEKYGVVPKQLIETKALMGDASDNIPGVAGVGEKTAFALIQKFGTMEGVYDNLEDESIKPGVRQKLIAGKESAELSRRLAVIDCEVPIDTAAGAYKKRPPNAEKAAAMLTRLEMYSILDRLGLESVQLTFEENKDAPALPEVEAKPLPAAPAGKVYLAPIEGGWLLVPAEKQEVYYTADESEALIALLADAASEKLAFDTKELHKLALSAQTRAENLTFDAKLAAYLLNPAAADYSVTRLAAEYGISGEFACPEYPEAPLLAGLYKALAAACEEADMTKLLWEMEQPLAEVLASMELAGMAVDADGIRAFGEELQAELQKQLASIYETVGYEFNVNSPKQLGEALFDKMGLPHGKKTKTGWSTNAETLEALRKEAPVVDTILLYRTYQKLNSTYVEGLLKVIGPDGRIHSTFNQTEARTGRLSSNEPNLQNIPVRTELGSRMRKFFIAPAGHLLADADYSQIELRILADIADDAAMKEAFLQKQDIHRATAARVNGLPLDMVTPQMRSAAKAVNFGIVYGIGAFSLSKDIGISVKEADQFISTYLDNFPGVRTYRESTIAFGKEHGYVATLYGRRRALPELASSNFNIRSLGERIALNTPIQGTAADIIKLAMIRVYRRLQREGLKARLVLQVHDELIVEAPKDEITKVAAVLQEEMMGAASLSVPLDADVHSGQNWLEAKG